MSEGPNIEKQPSSTQLRTLWCVIILLAIGLIFTIIMVIRLGNETVRLNQQLSTQGHVTTLPAQNT